MSQQQQVTYTFRVPAMGVEVTVCAPADGVDLRTRFDASRHELIMRGRSASLPAAKTTTTTVATATTESAAVSFVFIDGDNNNNNNKAATNKDASPAASPFSPAAKTAPALKVVSPVAPTLKAVSPVAAAAAAALKALSPAARLTVSPVTALPNQPSYDLSSGELSLSMLSLIDAATGALDAATRIAVTPATPPTRRAASVPARPYVLSPTNLMPPRRDLNDKPSWWTLIPHVRVPTPVDDEGDECEDDEDDDDEEEGEDSRVRRRG